MKYFAILGLVVSSFFAGGCSSPPTKPEPDFEEEAVQRKQPDLDTKRILLGKVSAPVTIIEYGDFQCPACAVGAAAVKTVYDKHPDKIRFIYKHMPLDYHPMAFPTAEAFEFLMAKDKAVAYRFYQAAFETPGKIKTKKDYEALLKKFKVTEKELKALRKKGQITELIFKDQSEFVHFGFRGTPAFLVNGIVMSGAPTAEDLEKLVLSEL